MKENSIMITIMELEDSLIEIEIYTLVLGILVWDTDTEYMNI